MSLAAGARRRAGPRRGASAADPAAQTEAEYLAGYDPTRFPRLAVTVDTVLMTIRGGRLCVLLVRRASHPFRGRWALPGGFVGADEDLDEAAGRELSEETGIEAAGWYVEQLRTYGGPDRDPRMRVVSVAYLALTPDLPVPAAGSDASEARLWPVEQARRLRLAFDHHRILLDGIERARAKLEYTGLATSFVAEPFTIADLRRVYETVWDVPLHPANFRRKVLATPGLVVPIGRQAPTGRGRTELYRRGRSSQLHPPIMRPRAGRGR